VLLEVRSPFILTPRELEAEIRAKTVILIIALAIWLFKRRSQKKNKKSLNIKSRGLDDASSDRESIVPLVQGDMKESDSLYSYKDKSMHV